MFFQLKPYLRPALAVIVLGAVFFVGVGVGERTIPTPNLLKDARILPLINKEAGQPSGVDASLLWDAWNLLEEKFADRGKLDKQEMLYGAIEGLVKSLGDPYTTFLDPRDSQTFLEDVRGSLEGIGIEIGIRRGVLSVLAPLEGTPADKAGLKAGDQILQINGESTIDLALDAAVRRIRGPKGTEVTLLIGRTSWDEPRKITIVRDVIRIPILSSRAITPNVTYIKLNHFSQSASPEFARIASALARDSNERLILDLRNNPGGFLEIAVDIASWFIPEGKVVALEEFGNGRRQEYLSTRQGLLAKIPTVVLVNQGSASAAEILAGALRDQNGVKLIGEKTFGKGSIQELTELEDGSTLKITIAKWLTPSGKSLMDGGLEPDIEVKPAENGKEGEDPQLDKALEVVKSF